MKNKLSMNSRKCLLAILCCMIIMPGMIYAQEEQIPLQVEQEQYILERTGDILVKILGSIELDGRETSRTQVVLTHNSPNGESMTHLVRTNNYGYYEFYFIHNWDSARGVYDINISNNSKSIDNVTYELVQDPSYKLDKQVKDEYWIKEVNNREIINTVINAWEYYEGNKKEVNYWMKNIFHWYYTNSITEEEVISSVQYLIENNILKFD